MATGHPLKVAIEISRGQAENGKLFNIHQNIKTELAPFFPPVVFNEVRFTTSWHTTLSLQNTIIANGEASVITLGPRLVVFRTESGAETAPVLWAHELEHVMQYRATGTVGFAEQYTRSWNWIENRAYEQQNYVEAMLSGGRCKN